MKPNIYLLVLLLGALSLGSCTQRIFLPNYANAPFLKEKGEVNLTASIKMQNQAGGGKMRFSNSTDAAYAITDNIGLIASFRHTNKFANENFWASGGGENQDSIVYSGNMFEVGAGYFMPLNRKGHFEVYGGGGYGHLNRDNLKIIDGYRTDYARIFVQPAIALLHKDVIEFGGGTRLVYQRFYNFQGSDANQRYEYTKSHADVDKLICFMFEPFVQFSAGYRYVKFNVQTGFSANMSTPVLKNPFQPYVSMGLKFSLAPRYSK